MKHSDFRAIIFSFFLLFPINSGVCGDSNRLHVGADFNGPLNSITRPNLGPKATSTHLPRERERLLTTTEIVPLRFSVQRLVIH